MKARGKKRGIVAGPHSQKKNSPREGAGGDATAKRPASTSERAVGTRLFNNNFLGLLGPQEAQGAVEHTQEIGRVPTGIAGLDALIEGGFERNSINTIMGGPGTGKTIIAFQFIYNGAVQFNEPGVFINLQQHCEQCRNHMRRLGFDIDKLEREKKLVVLSYAPSEIAEIIKSGGTTIKDAIDSIGAKRLVIDPLNELLIYYEKRYAMRTSVEELSSLLRRWNVTTLATLEMHGNAQDSMYPSTQFVSDGVIVLSTYYEGNIRNHAVEVLKMKGTRYPRGTYPYYITDNGVVVFPNDKVFCERIH